jgi:hypothetical protein
MKECKIDSQSLDDFEIHFTQRHGVTVAIVELNRERVVLRLLVMLKIQKNMCQTVLFLS